MPKLILKFESAVLKEIPITSSVVTVGRKPDNDLVIDHPAVSSHHCKIMLQGDIYFVEDQNSTNGTLLNDKKIIKAGIHHQDSIGIAKHSLVFIDDRPVTAQEIAQRAEKEAAAQGSEKVRAQVSPGSASAAASVSSSESSQIRRALEKIGGLSVISGAVDQANFMLTENSTYIGKSERVNIKIKGVLAPEVAAMVARKSNGYFLVAIKDGYPKVNGIPVHGERSLNEGDVIEVGGTTLSFYLKNPS